MNETLYVHVGAADKKLLPIKAAIECGSSIVIYGPKSRSGEIHNTVSRLREEFIFANGITAPLHMELAEQIEKEYNQNTETFKYP